MYKNNNDLTLKDKFSEWGRLVRLHTVAASATVAFIGHLTVAPMSIETAIVLFIIVSLIHMSGCTLNDLYDLDYDSNDPEKANRPLVKGTITPESAWGVSYSMIFLALIMMVAISPILFLVGICLLAFGIHYNIRSKESILTDISFSIWETGLVLVGAIVAGGFNIVTAMFCAFMFIQSFYQIQEGSMKDIRGPENTLLKLVGVSVKDGKVLYPIWLKSTTYGVKLFQVVIIWLAIYAQYAFNGAVFNIYTIAVLVAVAVNSVVFIHSVSVWLVDEFNRDEIIKGFTIHELTGAIIALLALYPSAPGNIVNLIVFIPLWVLSVNYLIHKEALIPSI